MSHDSRSKFTPGDHWVVCDVCEFEYRASAMRKRWDGLWVCPADFEQRHPQDFVRAVKDDISAKGLVHPEPADEFASGFCTTRTAVTGQAVAGCVIAGFVAPAVPASTF